MAKPKTKRVKAWAVMKVRNGELMLVYTTRSYARAVASLWVPSVRVVRCTIVFEEPKK